MEKNQLNYYYQDLLDWTKNFQKILETDSEARADNQLLLKLGQFKEGLEDAAGEQPSAEKLKRLSQEAETLYREFNPNDTFVAESELVVNRKEGQLKRVPIGGHNLPTLPYDYDALEPFIDEEIMRLHHSEHHKSYVEGLNKAEKEMEKARQKNDYSLIKHWEREAAFNGAGHYLHTIFWNVMSPKGGGEPRGVLREQIELDFGSYDKFKSHFSEAAKNVEAVGWTILVWAPRAGRMEILQAEKHQNLSQWDVVPILPIDVWEHAYYLQYKNQRELYVDNWWNIVNWEHASKRFEQAKQLQW
ncbi:superoxide dismutase [Bacillaceae bacterium IKA-2]|nr:superoxide dismutase [Bacillaceae bacterium IKA-2]